MDSKLNFDQRVAVSVGRSGKPSGQTNSRLEPQGNVVVEHWRQGEHIATYRFKNGIVNQGKNYLLDDAFDLATRVTAWYMLLVDNAGFTALANDDIYDDINQAGNGWDEFDDYTDPANGSSATTRPLWNPAPASAQSISNSSQVVFDITASGTVKGLGIVGNKTGATAVAQNKNDHGADGYLWATALFDQGDTAVVNGDQLKITYTISC